LCERRLGLFQCGPRSIIQQTDIAPLLIEPLYFAPKFVCICLLRETICVAHL
jgi:hypothetical protein